MPAGSTPGEPVRDPRSELDAERAATEHWRRAARTSAADLARLRHHPVVRAVIAAERRLEPLRGPVARIAGRARALVDRVALFLAALASRRPQLTSRTGSLPPAPATTDPRALTLVVVGADPPPLAPAGPGSMAVRVLAADPGRDAVGRVRRAIESTDDELVGIVLGTTEAIGEGWLEHLVNAIGGDVVAATPLLVHPKRPLAAATPHDGRVRAAGLAIDVDDEGAPVVRAVRAGTPPAPDDPTSDVDAASAAAVVVDRSAYDAAGGLPLAGDLDVAVVELCAHLRDRGGRIVVVPGSVMLDTRAVRSKRELYAPIASEAAGWRAAIDRSGPVLVRSARPIGEDRLRFALTIAAPSAKVALRWGDWHLAEGLAGALTRLGHEVRLQTADHADDPAGRAADVHVVLRGLTAVRRSPGQRHVLWIISHPESIDDEELDAADLVLVASERFAEHLRSRTATPIEVLLQATDPGRFHPRPADPGHEHPVTIVAKTRGVLRPVVADALSVGLRPAIYGGGWHRLVDPALVVADHVDNEELPVVYASAGVVLNDHWRTMQTWGFVSNRLYDVLACGTPVISDPVTGMAELFDGAVLEYQTPGELRTLVDAALADPGTARLRAERGRIAVCSHHTFDHRAGELLEALVRNAKEKKN